MSIVVKNAAGVDTTVLTLNDLVLLFGALTDLPWDGTPDNEPVGVIALLKTVAQQVLSNVPAAITFGTLTAAQTAAVQNAIAAALGTAADLDTVVSMIGLMKKQNGYLDQVEGLLTPVATEVTLGSILLRMATLGQKVMSGSSPVVLASNHDPIDTVVKATATSRSASVGVGATPLMPVNAVRRGFSIQNQHATAKIYINGSGTAVVADGSSLMIGPGQYFESNPTHSGGGAISIISDTAATPVYAREW